MKYQHMQLLIMHWRDKAVGRDRSSTSKLLFHISLNIIFILISAREGPSAYEVIFHYVSERNRNMGVLVSIAIQVAGRNCSQFRGPHSFLKY